MNKLVLACATLMALVTASVACEEQHRCGVVKAYDGFLNLRTGPNTQSRIVAPVKNGLLVFFDETVNGWVHVSIVDGDFNQQGWMNKSHLKILNTCPKVVE
jgi:uncharacterized protein YgiM (DUF1202 family)